MRLTLLILSALLPATSAWGWFGSWSLPFTWGWGSSGYYRGQCTCVSTRIPLDDKMALLGRDNDHNNDGLVTYDDFYYDVTERFDKNNDKMLSEGECVERFRCAYGNTEQVAQFLCANIMSGEAITNITLFNREPFISGVPLSQFVANNRALYEQFFTNRCTNRDISVEEKLALNAKNNDYNGDGLVTTQDLEYDLRNFYDANKDGSVSKAEFVIRWVCNYADRGDYARYLWDIFFQGVSSVPINVLSGPPYDTGVPIDDFKANNRQNYENFRTRDASAYIQPRA